MQPTTSIDELILSRDETDPLVVRVDLSGRSISRDPSRALLPYFTELIDGAARGNVALELHFEKLEYFNSSTISAVIQVINYAQRQKVALTLVHDRAKRWQGMSFDALKRALKPFDVASGGQITFQVAG